MIQVLSKLMEEYENKYGEIELKLFLDATEEDKIKILKECLDKDIQIYENEYFNDTYMEIVVD